MSPTVIPQVAGRAIPLENDRDLLSILEAVDGTLTAVELPAPILDEGEQMAADLVTAKAKYALGLFNFHQVGSDEAVITRRESVDSAISDSDTVETPILESPSQELGAGLII